VIKSSENESPGKSIPGTTKNYNKAKGGNYHEYDNSHHYHRIVFSVRRGWRLLVEQTTVGA